MIALEAIAAERRRQIEAEGWTAEHDDSHAEGEMFEAAMSYFAEVIYVEKFGRPQPTVLRVDSETGLTKEVPFQWPWQARWWKPKDPYRNLVRAGALMLAEIERLERAGLTAHHAEHKLRQVVAVIEDREPSGT